MSVLRRSQAWDSPRRKLRVLFKAASRQSQRGFTLLELLTVCLIIAVLAVLGYGAWDQFRSRAERVNCSSNLRQLHAGLSSYLTNQGRWPQCPHKIQDKQFDRWWIDEMLKLGIAEKQWKCPTLMRATGSFDAGLGERDPNAERTAGQKHSQIHYMPTPFDDQPMTPRRWPTQPWLIEIGNMHGEGPLMVFPDGVVLSFVRFNKQGR
jgi:prepilin-type N-terminal cleavage/methylation domain-containing protein